MAVYMSMLMDRVGGAKAGLLFKMYHSEFKQTATICLSVSQLSRENMPTQLGAFFVLTLFQIKTLRFWLSFEVRLWQLVAVNGTLMKQEGQKEDESLKRPHGGW